ncbi:FAD-binding oxidoreductase [Parasphingorhabdus pacifica]
MAKALGARMSGMVLGPGDADFEAARRVFNSAIETEPAVLARCANSAEISTALSFARENGLDIAVRSGGHSVAGASLVQDGLVIDLRAMNEVSVDPSARTMTVGGGAVWADVDRATQPHGLATTGGRVSSTGVAGLTLGGGSGWLERKFGLACDNLLSVDVVIADGTEVTASELENPELFWALHGGGGNFGIASRMTFRLHELPEFSMALMLWEDERGPVALRGFRDLIKDAPDEIGGAGISLTAPPETFVPERLVGSAAFAVLVTCVGPARDLRERVAPMLALNPAGSIITDIPYADLQCMLDDPPGYRNYWSGEYLRELSDTAVDTFCLCSESMIVPSPSQNIIVPWDGKVARSDGKWPMSNRSAPWVVHPLGMWSDPADDERAVRWARGIRASMRPFTTGSVYLNFIGDEGQDRIVAGFGEENYRRLARVKAQFDPDNTFNRWHNVLPARPAGVVG